MVLMLPVLARLCLNLLLSLVLAFGGILLLPLLALGQVLDLPTSEHMKTEGGDQFTHFLLRLPSQTLP